MNREYPENDQRAAVCNSQWRKSKSWMPQYGTVEGPLGFPMPEDAARLLESELKATSETTLVHKAATADVQLAEGERAEISLISTDSLDRDSEVVPSGSLNLKLFRKNPVVTLSHKYDLPPVGTAQWIKRDQDGYKAKTHYPPKPDDVDQWLPSVIFGLVKAGAMRGKSVGFLAQEWRPPTDSEKKARPELDRQGVRVLKKGLLVEYAVATIPVNPDAVVQAVSKGLELPGYLEDMLDLAVPSTVKKAQPEPEPKEDKEPAIPTIKRYWTREAYDAAINRQVLKQLTTAMKFMDRDVMNAMRGTY